MSKKLLLLSNSTLPGQNYLEFALDTIQKFLGDINSGVFIPFAAVTFSYDEYEYKVNEALRHKNIRLKSIHKHFDMLKTVYDAECIVVGGGNTFRLLERCYHYELIDIIREKVNSGTPYIGWSAGSNLAGPTICTTNDMPIIQPPEFRALELINLQINPHYTNLLPDGHKGETRDQRLEEFLALNPKSKIAAIPEGTYLLLDNKTLTYHGKQNAHLMEWPWKKSQIPDGSNLVY